MLICGIVLSPSHWVPGKPRLARPGRKELVWPLAGDVVFARDVHDNSYPQNAEGRVLPVTPLPARQLAVKLEELAGAGVLGI